MSLSAGAMAGPLRVLNVMLGARSGGLERSIVSFHEALSAGGADVTSVLSPGAWARSLFGPDRRIVEVETSERLAWLARRQMASALKGRAFDVVLAHGNRAVKAAIGLGEAPLVAVAHTTNLNLAKFGHRLDGVILPGWAPPHTLADLRPSSLAAQHLELFRALGVADEAIACLPHALRAADWRQPPAANWRPVIGALGRFDVNKGFDVLIEAAGRLKVQGRNFRLTIAGADASGSVDELRKAGNEHGLTQEDLVLPGWSNDPASFLGSLDIFCLPSRRETFGFALLEAMAASRPVFASRLPDLADAFEDGKEGRFFTCEDAGDLAQALDPLLGDSQERARLAANAHARAMAFDYEAVGPLYVETLRRLAALRANA